MYAWSGGADARRRRLQQRFPFVYALFRNKFYIDDFYQWAINNVVLGFATRHRLLRPRRSSTTPASTAPARSTSGLGWVLKFHADRQAAELRAGDGRSALPSWPSSASR